METILLVVLIVIVITMIGLVLLQRSEGGALGIGGPGAMFSARGTASLLTRATAGPGGGLHDPEPGIGHPLRQLVRPGSRCWIPWTRTRSPIEAEPLVLPGELDLPTDIEPLDLLEDDRPAVPRAE